MRYCSLFVIGGAVIGFCAAPVEAQIDNSARISALEKELAERQASINEQAAQIEAQLEQLQLLQGSLDLMRRQIAELKGAPLPPPEQVAATPVGGGLLPSVSGCALATPSEQELALRLDNRPRMVPTVSELGPVPRLLPDLESCDAAQFKPNQSNPPRGLFGYIRDSRSRLLFDEAASVVPGRPVQAAGIRPTIELGNTSSASLTLSVPFFGRFCETAREPGDRCSGSGFRPYALSPYVSLSTPLSSGTGKLVSRTFGEPNPLDEPSSLGFASGTSIKVGGDLLVYGRTSFSDASKELQKVLADAIQACLADLHDKRIKGGLQVDTSVCQAEKIVDWILALKADSTATAGFSHAREELAARLLNVGWRPRAAAVPWIGIGASFQYGSSDFKFQQASVTDQVIDGKTVVVPDFSTGLSQSRTVARDQYDIEGHLLFYYDFDRGRSESRGYTPSPYVPGIMLVPQVTYSWRHEFASGTALTRCKADPVEQPADCSVINIDRPRRRELTTGSIELRWQLNNVPVMDRLGFAPRFSYVFEDDGYTVDFPVYFLKDSKLSAGIRGRYVDGLDDVLGNERDSALEVSLFFSPLTFTGF